MCTGVCRQFYRDALPLIGTSASVSVMRSLMTSQQATSKETDIWLTSLAFIKNPTRDMMTELKVCELRICLSACCHGTKPTIGQLSLASYPWAQGRRNKCQRTPAGT